MAVSPIVIPVKVLDPFGMFGGSPQDIAIQIKLRIDDYGQVQVKVNYHCSFPDIYIRPVTCK